MLMLPNANMPPEIQWSKNPDWTYTLIAYLGDHLAFHLKLFSDSTANAVKEGCLKHTVKDGTVQQYAILTNHIFALEPGQSVLYLQNPGRFGIAVETHLRQYDHLLSIYLCQLMYSSSLKSEYVAHLKVLGGTGAGLDPLTILKGSPITNIMGAHQLFYYHELN
jgi:hypothetical protein